MAEESGFFNVFIVFIMTMILLMYLYQNTSEVHLVRSGVDGRFYLVRKLPDSQEAADMLALLNAKLVKLVQHVRAKYPKDADMLRLYNNFDPDNVSEGGVEHGYTSYSVDKGEKIVMCVRQKDAQNSFVDTNVLVYVAVHELAHLMTKDIGHSDTFWGNFKRLLREAMDAGIYKRVDYAKAPKEYCGIQIKSSII
jgi:hypothetical protein